MFVCVNASCACVGQCGNMRACTCAVLGRVMFKHKSNGAFSIHHILFMAWMDQSLESNIGKAADKACGLTDDE